MTQTIKNSYILDHDDANALTKRKRVLKALGGTHYADYPRPAMTDQQARVNFAVRGSARWEPSGDALAYTESCEPTTDPVVPPRANPEITITGGSGIT